MYHLGQSGSFTSRRSVDTRGDRGKVFISTPPSMPGFRQVVAEFHYQCHSSCQVIVQQLEVLLHSDNHSISSDLGIMANTRIIVNVCPVYSFKETLIQMREFQHLRWIILPRTRSTRALLMAAFSWSRTLPEIYSTHSINTGTLRKATHFFMVLSFHSSVCHT